MKPDSADIALQSYLDALLQPEQPAPSAPSRPFAEPQRLRALPPVAPPPVTAAVDTAPIDIAPVAVAPVEITPAPMIAPVAIATAPVAEAVASPVTAAAEAAAAMPPLQTDQADPIGWADNGRPEWAQRPFEALLFSVGGLSLAVPLVELGTVSPLDPEAMTPLFGQADWFLGLLPGKAGNTRIVDSARVVMPERYDAAMPAAYRYVITLNGSDWGLGVDAIRDAVRLDPERVRWRGARGKRLWLAGTVVDHMCALLDVAQLTRLFQRADRRRAGSGRRHGDA
jgi:purine-binding chemotaxis protein CheW